MLLVGTGNNGGDALFAGALLARRGARVTAVLLDPERAHPAGLAALRGAGGRVLAADAADRLARADLVSTACSASAAAAACGPTRPRWPRSPPEAAGSPSRSTFRAGSTPTPARSTGAAFPAMHTVTFGAVKLGLVVGDGRGRRRGAPVDIGLGRTCRRRRRRLTDADVAALLAAAVAGRRQVLAGRRRHRRRLGDLPRRRGALHRRRPADPARPGPLRRHGAPTACARAWPEAIVTDGRPADAGRVQAWVVGPGMGTDDDARSVLAEVLATDLPVIVDADGLTMLAEQPDLVRDRTRADRAHPARPRVRAVRVRAPAPTASARPAGWPPSSAAPSCSRATRRSWPTPTGRRSSTAPARPWLATAGTGDVLSGIAGALLAAGPAARSTPARPPRTCTAAPGSCAAERGPCWPATWSGGCPRRSAGARRPARRGWSSGRDAVTRRPEPRSSSTSTRSPPTPRAARARRPRR